MGTSAIAHINVLKLNLSLGNDPFPRLKIFFEPGKIKFEPEKINFATGRINFATRKTNLPIRKMNFATEEFLLPGRDALKPHDLWNCSSRYPDFACRGSAGTPPTARKA